VTLPNLFIAGAPKCGTTAMFHYLGAHNGVFASAVKEPHYFAFDLGALESRVKSLDAYLELFKGATAEQPCLAEASVWYLYSSSALEEIHRFNPDAKIIVMLRNPIDLVNSLHLDYCGGYIETQFDLETAWNLSGDPRRELSLTRACPYAKLLDYKAIGRLGEQVQRLLDVFPRRQVKLFLFDDLVHRTMQSYQEALAFLGLSDDGRTEFPRVNESIVNRSRRITNWLGISPDRHLEMATSFKRWFGDDRLGIVHALERANTTRARRTVESSLRTTMRTYYETDIARLATLLDRDLSHWN
jgi:hypothetical protein